MGKIKLKYGYNPAYSYQAPPFVKKMINDGDLEADTIIYPKHPSVTDADIGKLMMVDAGTPADPITNIGDYDYTAIVTNPVAAQLGVEAQHQFTIPFLTEPKCKNVNIAINCIPTAGETLVFNDVDALTSWTITFVNGSPMTSSEVQVDGGATTFTIATAISSAMTTNVYGANQVVTDNGDGTANINVDLLLGDQEAGFTNDSTYTPPACITVTMVSDHTADIVYTTAKAVYDTDIVLNNESWITGQNYYNNTCTLLRYDDLFEVARGNPHGHAGTGYLSGMIFYNDATEFALGVTWAIGNNDWSGTIFQYDFNDGWTLISSVASGADVLLTIETLTPPNNGSQTLSFYYGGTLPDLTVTEIVEGVSTQVPSVMNFVLGTLMHVDGDYCTINTSVVQPVVLHSEAYGVTPLLFADYIAQQNGGPWLIAWKDGKVIDYFAYLQIVSDAGITGDIVSQGLWVASLLNGHFTTYEPGFAGSTVYADRSTSGFFSLYLGA